MGSVACFAVIVISHPSFDLFLQKTQSSTMTERLEDWRRETGELEITFNKFGQSCDKLIIMTSSAELYSNIYH